MGLTTSRGLAAALIRAPWCEFPSTPATTPGRRRHPAGQVGPKDEKVGGRKLDRLEDIASPCSRLPGSDPGPCAHGPPWIRSCSSRFDDDPKCRRAKLEASDGVVEERKDNHEGLRLKLTPKPKDPGTQPTAALIVYIHFQANRPSSSRAALGLAAPVVSRPLRTPPNVGRSLPKPGASVDAGKLGVNLSRISADKASAERQSQDGLNLRFFVDVYALAPPIVLLTKEDNLDTGRVPDSAPTHQEVLQFLTPRGLTPPPTGRLPRRSKK